MHILLVDDDRELVELLSFALQLARAVLDPIPAYDAESALRQFEEHHPDLVVLDISLGASSGLDVLKELRQRSAFVPVIMLTALDSEQDKVRGLNAGADDYLTKPFSHRELVARIQAQLRRNGVAVAPPPLHEPILKVGSITLNLEEHSVTRGGRPINLTPMEFRLLQYLMMNAGRAVPTSELLRQVWGYQDHRFRSSARHGPPPAPQAEPDPGQAAVVAHDSRRGRPAEIRYRPRPRLRTVTPRSQAVHVQVAQTPVLRAT